jgi:DNA polymerase-3 subunit chi
LTRPQTRVDFYVLATRDAGARLRFTCRLAEKAYIQRHRTHAHAATAAQVRELDELLWTFRQGSFLPHQVSAPDAEELAPITIGHIDPAGDNTDFLINLANEIPTFFDRFNRVAEIIDSTEECRRLGRERFSFYRDNGYQPNTHKID